MGSAHRIRPSCGHVGATAMSLPRVLYRHASELPARAAPPAGGFSSDFLGLVGCSGTPAALSLRTRAPTRAPCRRISAIETFSTPCATPNCRPRASRTSGATDADWPCETARHGYASAQAKTRRSTVSAFVSKQRPWLIMMRSGRHESIFSTAALVLFFCKRSGNRIPKNTWPVG